MDFSEFQATGFAWGVLASHDYIETLLQNKVDFIHFLADIRFVLEEFAFTEQMTM